MQYFCSLSPIGMQTIIQLTGSDWSGLKRHEFGFRVTRDDQAGHFIRGLKILMTQQYMIQINMSRLLK